MARARRLQRVLSGSSNSSTSTSPERGADDDDDNDSIMLQANDSQSSLGLDPSADQIQDAERRRLYEQRCRVSPVHRLPAELLIAIFSRLNAPQDLQNCMLVSKDWARNSVGLLWHRPAMNKWESIQSVIQTIHKSRKFFAYQDLVKRLNMSTLSHQVSDGALIGMAECKRIERLTLTNCVSLTDGSLRPLLQGNRSLLALDVTGLDQLTDETMLTVAENCLRLQGLNVTGCKQLTDTSIVALAKSCRHLKRLKFNNCTQLTDTSIMTIAAHSSHLLEIDLQGLQNVESPAVTALLSSCSNLREMRLAHCSRIDDSAFLNLKSEGERPLCFDALRILDLTDCSELGDKGVERIIQTCPRLRNVVLAKCRQITDRAVFAIAKLGKNLHYIHLGHCQRITDSSVEVLAKACNRIRYIDLACCSNLTDHSITRLAGLPKLKRIGLVKCGDITDRSIYALAFGEHKNGKRVHGTSVLERVHLSYCTLLTIDGIHALLNHCPKLTHLSLTGVHAFLQEDLLAFCREAPPEFNDLQRNVFCVFSGNGVSRLRDYINERKARARLMSSRTYTMDVNYEQDMDTAQYLGNAADDDEVGGSVIDVDVHGNHPPGSTPVIPFPGEAEFDGRTHPYVAWRPIPPLPPRVTNLSSSAPAGPMLEGGTWPQPGPSLTSSPLASPSSPANGNMPNPSAGMSVNPAHALAANVHGQYGSGARGSPAGAQHVTSMMGATMLDDVDEGDEVFDEDSELVGY